MPLPIEVLRQRLYNEILTCKKELRHIITVSDSSLSTFPIEIDLTFVKTPGPFLWEGKVTTRYTHKVKIIITAQYPYQKPIVRWLSPIFHPNIMPPHEGGYVCTKLFDTWTPQSTLLMFIKGLETLLSNPNPGNPLGSEACQKAAEYFDKHPYKPPVIVEKTKTEHAPKIVGGTEDGEGKA
ncbi:MAG: ubiquitin-conjugating enzyme E2 [Thermoplasmata archaeon]